MREKRYSREIAFIFIDYPLHTLGAVLSLYTYGSLDKMGNQCFNLLINKLANHYYNLLVIFAHGIKGK